MTEIELLNDKLEKLERKEAIEELKREHNWCGIHNQPLTTGQYYYQQNLFQQSPSSLMGNYTSNTIANTPLTYGPYCPKCLEEKEFRRKELLRKLGHEW